MRAYVGVAVVLAVSVSLLGCFPGDDTPTGTAYVYVRHITGECPVLQAASDIPDFPCPANVPAGKVCALDQIARLGIPYETVNAVAALSGASAFAGGNLLSVAWQGGNGEVSRLYLDIGPSRGLGALLYPWPRDSYDQAVGFTEWRDGQRTFTARSVFAGMEWERMPDGNGLEVNLLAALTGVDSNGATACRTIGVHAETAHERDLRYDPSWLQASPSIMFDPTATVSPSYTGDAVPSATLVSAASAGADPGGVAPAMTTRLPSICGVHSACGGGGGCC